MDLHRPYIAKAVLAPDLLVKLIGRKKGVRVADKEGQDAVFHISQMDAAAVLLYACLLYTSPEPTRRTPISYAVFCLKKKKEKKNTN